MDFASIRRSLNRWYSQHARDLPWRRTRDPYAIWISEIMLQQTRVAAVIPYYERFLLRFPTPADLAQADEAEVLTLWAGLGYYSRARNLQKAARQIAAAGAFPPDHASILELAGVGAYTAAAIASIAFDLPHAVIDGNVRRVVMRLCGSAEVDVAGVADQLLDRRDPGRSNQALMELGATICVPSGEPKCEVCPVRKYCEGFAKGIQKDLPPPKSKPDPVKAHRTLLIIRSDDEVLLVPSPRVAGFWELPEPGPGIRVGAKLGEFTHSITNTRYRFEVCEGRATKVPREARRWPLKNLETLPLSTASKKALRCLNQG